MKCFIYIITLLVVSSCRSNIEFELASMETVNDSDAKLENKLSGDQLQISNGMSASIVIGQVDFNSNSQNIDGGDPKPNSIRTVEGIYSDYINDRLLIADRSNSRVLVFNSYPTANGASADFAIGQTDLISGAINSGGRSGTSLYAPRQVVWNGSELFIADTGNHRTLVWTSFPADETQAADYVIGQPDLASGTANNGGRSAQTISSYYAHSVFATANNVFTAEHGSNRVLIHNLPITSNFQAADYVIGAPDFLTSGSGSASDSNLNLPTDVWSNDEIIIIADRYKHRVLIHQNFPGAATGATHDIVIGQPDMNSQAANQGIAVSANTLVEPHGVFYDGQRLFISDTGNHRVLVFNSLPTSNNASADYVIGQPDFNSNSSNQGGSVGANTLSSPSHLFYDKDCGCLLVADKGNHRVLLFN